MGAAQILFCNAGLMQPVTHRLEIALIGQPIGKSPAKGFGFPLMASMFGKDWQKIPPVREAQRHKSDQVRRTQLI